MLGEDDSGLTGYIFMPLYPIVEITADFEPPEAKATPE